MIKLPLIFLWIISRLNFYRTECVYIEEPDQTLKLIRLNEYAILAEEGLRDVDDHEPDVV